MSRTSALVAGAAGMAIGAGLLTILSGRSRPEIPGMGDITAPPGLPPARVVPLPGRGEMFFREQQGPSVDAPTVLLLHGWVVTADLNWFRAYPPLADVAHVIAPDHRGHGRASRPSRPYRLVDVADDVAALLRELGTGPVIVVGYSMGGPIGQLLWQRHPDLVAGMVLCATASHFRFGPFQGAHWRLMAFYQVILRILPRTWLERIMLAQMRGTAPVRVIRTVTEEMSGSIPLLPWIVGEIERGDVEDVAEAGRELGRFDSRGWLRGVDRPGAVIVTTGDRLVPPSTQLELAGLLPEALVLEVDGDHEAPSSNARDFNAALVQAVAHVRGHM